jgi:hypothetical protein
MTDLSSSPDEEAQLEEPEALASELGLGIDLTDAEREQAEEMVSRLRDQFGLPDEVVAQDEPDEEPDEEPDQEEEAPEPEPESEPVAEPAEPVAQSPYFSVDGREYVIVDGTPVALDEIRQARRLATQEPAPEPEPEPEPVPPDFLDMDDPRDAFIWRQMVEQNKALRSVADLQNRTLQDQTKTRLQGDVTSALTTFRTNHPELTEGEIDTVRLHAVALDIVDGLARTRSGPDAVLKALDIAYLDHPEFRAKALGEPSPAQVKASERKARKGKLAGLAGSSGAAPRQASEPIATTDREARQQATKWLIEQNIL